jgi:hypothetical protein|tara:strand:+ start:1090 stop:1245 length:156 start_codon:yes stop_codon:yes gene_type:complete
MVFWKKRTGKKITPVRQGVRGGYWKKVFCGETVILPINFQTVLIFTNLFQV